MRVSYEWIKELVDIDLPAEQAAHELTLAGLEVEDIERVGDDYVFEVNVTPNRPDCLSVLGIAREFAAITGKPLKFPEHDVADEGETSFKVEIVDEDLCGRYAGRVVRGIRVEDSPGWMQERLEKCGIRAINNVVDITNYVLLEQGHPLHAFDLGTLEGQVIRVGMAGKGRAMTTLDGVERKLPEEALLIWDAARPIAVAGVMGGAETEVSEITKDIFLESAWFRPQSVRRTSKALGLSTESSYRFERGTDMVNLTAALDRAAHLISKICGGKAEKPVDAYPKQFSPALIRVNFGKVNRVLGTALASDEITGLLEMIGLEITETTGEDFTVLQPPHRPDLLKDIDIVEEVARLYGYGKIPTIVPRAELAGVKTARQAMMSGIRETMRKQGFHEAVNYSFMNYQFLDVLGIRRGDRRRRCVKIKNPLRGEDAHLRSTLVPSLIGNFVYNVSRGMREVRLFEMARAFQETEGPLPKETLNLGAIFSREKGPSLYRDETEDFYLFKGTVESVLDRMRIADYTFTPTIEPFLHPGKSADLVVSDDKIGFLGVLSPKIVEQLEVKTGQDVLVLELDVEKLLSHAPRHVVYHEIPKYPPVERDIAIVVGDGTQAGDIIARIRAYPSDFIEDVGVFDSYKGKHIPKGKKSLAFSITYRSRERTLTEAEVEEIHKGLLEHLVRETGGEVRGQ